MTGGAATVAPACATSWCSKPVYARGKCQACYARWRRANPGLRMHLLNEDMVEELLPSRKKNLSERTGLSMGAINAVLKRLKAAGRARIGRWDPPHVTGSQFREVWVAGKGPDARKPGKKLRHDYGNKTRRERAARKEGRHEPPPAACWTDVLGIAA